MLLPLVAPAALAQAPTVVRASLSPAANTLSASRSTPLGVEFSQAINPATAGNIRVFSSQYRGRRTATASTSGSTVTLTPTVPATGSQLADLKPGETVQVTVPASVQSTGGTAASKYVYQFTAAATGGWGNMVPMANLATGSNPYGVATGDLDSDGDLDFVNTNNSAGTVSVQLNDGSGNFTPPATNPNPAVGSAPWGIVLGDVDGDGDLDFVTSNYSAGTVSVRLNNGSGNFTAPATNPNPAVGSNPQSVTLGDVDGDGDLDLLTANATTSGTVSVRLNNGSGNFAYSSDVAVGSRPVFVTLGDIDGDGDLDFVTSNGSGASASVRLNDGSGNYSPPVTNPEPAASGSPNGIALADVDGDGDLDFVTASNTSSGVISVRLNDGSGNFTAPASNPNPAVGNWPVSVALADLDGDGDLDAVTTNNTAPGSVSVLLNSGSGNFTPSAVSPIPAVGNNPQAVAVGDLDGDKDLDLVVANGFSNTASLLLNVPPLTVTSLSPAANARTAPRNTSVAVSFSQPINATTSGNIRVFSPQYRGRRTATASTSGSTVTLTPTVPATGSQLADFQPGETVQVTVPASVQSTGGAAASKYVYQFTAAVTGGTGYFNGGSDPSVGSSPRGVAVGDVDGDGDLDLLTANSGSNTVSVLLNNGSGTFTAPATNPNPSVGSSPRSVALGDVDGDGDLDLLAANNSSGSVSVRLNDGTGNFSGVQNVSVGTSPYSVALGDVDGDGDLDLLAANNTVSGTVSVRLNDGTGNFSGGSDPAVGSSPFQVAVGDVDKDGDLDFLTVNSDGNSVSVRINNGAGSFGGTQDVVVGTYPLGLAVGDVNGDGYLDFLAASNNNSAVAVRLNDGLGNFSGTQNVGVGTNPQSVALGDVDGDGDLDLVTANSGAATVAVRFNDGQGNFGGTQAVGVGSAPRNVALGDMDGDGDLDLVTANNIVSGTMSVRLNVPPPTISSFTPTSGGAGTVVTITGTSFTGATAIKFNGVAAASFTVVSATQATATVPGTATTGPITLTTPAGTATSASSFTVLPLTVTSLSPAANAISAPRTTSVAVSFSQPINSTTAGNIRVFSSQYRGRRTATASTSGSTVTLTPTVPATGSQLADFQPGETVQVTVPASVQSTGGAAASKYVYQFTAAVTGGWGNFGGGSDPAVGTTPFSVAVGDVDGDGDLDLLSANQGAATVSVRINDGTGSFSGTQFVSVGTGPRGIVMGDVDGDGDLDLLTANNGSNTVSVRVNNGSGTFSGTQAVSVGINPRSLVVGDVDGDGDLDLLTANNGSNTVSVRINNGSGTFSGGTDPAVGTTPQSVAMGDVDGDGDLDLLVANSGSGTVSVRLNNGAGTFSGSANPAVGSNPFSVAVGDVDGDGDLDLLCASLNSNTVSVRLNDGLGTFSGGSDPSVGGGPRGVAVGDVDGDGDLDLLTANYNSGTTSVRLNDGTGTFSGGSDSAVGSNPYTVAVGDVDGDGDLDLLACNASSNTVSVRLNVPPPTISGFTPNSGPAGTVVTLTGTNFTGATTIKFNGVAAASFTVVSATQATATVPGAATTGPISLTTPLGTATSSQVFTVYPSLVISTTGQTIAAGTYQDITITGTGGATLGGAVQVLGTLTVQTGGQLLTACQPLTGAGSFTLADGATLGICDPAGLTATGSTGAVQVSGTRTYSTDALYLYNGTQAQQTGSGLPGTVRSLELSNGQGATLSADVTAVQALTLTAGVLTTGPYTATLGGAAVLGETPTSYVTGTVQTTRTLNTAGTSENFGGVGLTLTPSGSTLPGGTLVRRITGTALSGAGTSVSIKRYYDIQPTVNAGLNVTVQLGYLDSELNGISESSLGIFRSSTGTSGPWQAIAAASQSTTANTVTATGVDHFSIWTLGNKAAPLPVELTTFAATAEGNGVRLTWATASEKNSARFEVERSRDGVAFAKIGETAAAGSSTAPRAYAYLDAAAPAGQLYYRLRQVDTGGTFTYSLVRTVHSGALATLQLWPNPAHASAQVSGLSAGAQVELFDALGRAVLRTQANAAGQATLALPAELPRGLYQMRSGAQTTRVVVE